MTSSQESKRDKLNQRLREWEKKPERREYCRKWQAERRAKDREAYNSYMREWRNKQPNDPPKSKGRRPGEVADKVKRNVYQNAWYHKNKDRINARNRQLNRERSIRHRKELLALFGDCCKHCGFSDWRALQLDHINGKGTQERKATRQGDYTADALLRRFRKDSELAKKTFQLLCANCNWIKRYENREVRQVD